MALPLSRDQERWAQLQESLALTGWRSVSRGRRTCWLHCSVMVPPGGRSGWLISGLTCGRPSARGVLRSLRHNGPYLSSRRPLSRLPHWAKSVEHLPKVCTDDASSAVGQLNSGNFAHSYIGSNSRCSSVQPHECTNPIPRLSHVLCHAGSPCTPLWPTGSIYPRGIQGFHRRSRRRWAAVGSGFSDVGEGALGTREGWVRPAQNPVLQGQDPDLRAAAADHRRHRRHGMVPYGVRRAQTGRPRDVEPTPPRWSREPR